MDGSVVGENSVVEAGSFVRNDTEIPPNQVWGGKPARYIRSIFKEDLEDNKRAVQSQNSLGQQHSKLQQDLLYQSEDYNDSKTFYHTQVNKE